MSRINFLQDLLSSVFSRQEPDSATEDTRSYEVLCDALLSERGEVSGNRIAATLLARFADADVNEQREFFELLVERFDIDIQHVQNATLALSENNTVENFSSLLNSVEPGRQELLRRLNRIPGATGQLVNMRAKLLQHLKDNPELKRIDLDFQRLFRAWFNRGFLVLREIDWHTPANVLEKLIEYEAVHAITGWEALRRRLAPGDRKCFAFFHPSMLDEPLIFVEVALTKSMPTSIRSILIEQRDVLDASIADTAVFYSISNCQAGLAGVSFGNFLIKQVAQELSGQLPELTTFRTLSPVPGFMRWVHGRITETDDTQLNGALNVVTRVASGEISELNDAEKYILQTVAAKYLVEERRADRQPLDPVARFHLGNGASLAMVLPTADFYRKGLEQSAGVMVSYLYDLDSVIANHESYATNRDVIVSDEVAALLVDNTRTQKKAVG